MIQAWRYHEKKQAVFWGLRLCFCQDHTRKAGLYYIYLGRKWQLQICQSACNCRLCITGLPHRKVPDPVSGFLALVAAVGAARLHRVPDKSWKRWQLGPIRPIICTFVNGPRHLHYRSGSEINTQARQSFASQLRHTNSKEATLFSFSSHL